MMKTPWFERYAVAVFVGSLALCVTINMLAATLPDTLTPVAISSPNLAPKPLPPSPTPTRAPYIRPEFERGMVFPRWGKDGYAPSDTAWTKGLQTIKQKTGTQWIEMPLQFSQSSGSATTLHASGLPTLAHFSNAIRQAHGAGYAVFIVPLFLVTIPDGWAASIQLPEYAAQHAWFASLFSLYAPYLRIAQETHVEQVSIGTELVWMQQYADPALWTTYLANIHGLYTGKLTYDSNWSEIGNAIPSWMTSQYLSAIGVSEYIPLSTTASTIAPGEVKTLWQQNIQVPLDTFANHLGKPVFLSEIGYRNSFDTFWNTWDARVHLPHDENERLAAITATLSLTFTDTHIIGVFWWGWQDTGAFDLVSDTSAQHVIAQYYERRSA